MARFAMLEFGCKVNRFDGQRVRAALRDAGYVEAEGSEPVDLAVVNACAVTDRAVRRGRQALRRLARERLGARLLVTGCMTPADRARYHATAAEVVTLPPAEVERLPELLASLAVAPAPVAAGGPGAFVAGGAFEDRTRVFLKVVDGCDAKCAFCVIPSIRGTIRSRPRAEVVAEAAGFLDRGFRELVLCGVHLGHYGRDFPGRGMAPDRLLDLALAVADLPGDFRVRLSSLEIGEVDAALAAALARHGKLAPHLHLPLQSGDDRVLRAMRRPYSAARYLEKIALLRAAEPDLALTTDVIVGFPGEDEAAFAATLAVVRAARFAGVHSFPFSPRAGTEAASLPDRVAPPLVRARVARLLQLARELRAASDRERLGKQARVLVETGDARASLGRCERSFRVRLPGGFANSTFVSCRIVGRRADDLIGEPRE